MAEKIIITQKMVDFLDSKRIFTSGKGNAFSSWFRPDKVMVNREAMVYPYSACYKGPSFSNIGCFSYTKSNFDTQTYIGRFCAIGQNCIIMPASHPIDRLSMCGMDYNAFVGLSSFADDHAFKFNQYPVSKAKQSKTIIGNDVWIGGNTVLKQGIKIGDGAAIGYGSIVTRDVPPYAVVAGIPAEIKKFRFPFELIQDLLNSQWFMYNPKDFFDLDTTNPAEFVKQFMKRREKQNLQPLQIEPINLYEALKGLSDQA